MNQLTLEEFIFLLDSYRERKKALEEGRQSLLSKLLDCEDQKTIIWEVYWKHSDVIGAREMAELLGMGVRELTETISNAYCHINCSECGSQFDKSFSSRTAYQDFLRDQRSKKFRSRTLCQKCKKVEQDAKDQQSKEFTEHQKKVQERIRFLGVMPYKEYLLTPEWQQIRKYKLSRCKYRCELCNATGRLHVHHKTYERRGQERESDLIVLCVPCHEKFHDKVSSGVTA